MSSLISMMMYNFMDSVSDLFFNANVGYIRGGGFITFITVVIGISIFVYIIRRLVGVMHGRY